MTDIESTAGGSEADTSTTTERDTLIDIAEPEDDTRVARELLPGALEAILMVVEEPVPTVALAQSVGHPVLVVDEVLSELAQEYRDAGRGFELREVAGGWRFYSAVEFDPVVTAFVLEGQQSRLSQAALETLAVVAYRQPISRSRISAIRGVNVDGVVRTLVTRGLLIELGHEAQSGAILYGTSSFFLERMGLTSLDELPELAPMLPELDDLDEELERVAAEVQEQESPPAIEDDSAASDGPEIPAEDTGEASGSETDAVEDANLD